MATMAVATEARAVIMVVAMAVVAVVREAMAAAVVAEAVKQNFQCSEKGAFGRLFYVVMMHPVVRCSVYTFSFNIKRCRA
jgi:hypothetical protein